MSEILDQTLECAKEILGAQALDLKIERAVVGLFFSGVKLSGGACGLSYTPLKSLSGAVCCPSQASAMPVRAISQAKACAICCAIWALPRRLKRRSRSPR